jgi:hypothetical protein
MMMHDRGCLVDADNTEFTKNPFEHRNRLRKISLHMINKPKNCWSMLIAVRKLKLSPQRTCSILPTNFLARRVRQIGQVYREQAEAVAFFGAVIFPGIPRIGYDEPPTSRRHVLKSTGRNNKEAPSPLLCQGPLFLFGRGVVFGVLSTT